MLIESFRLHDKVNNPPKNPDVQPVSKKFGDFIKLKLAAKEKKGQIKTVNDDFKAADSLFKKSSIESNRQHLRRVQKEINKRKVESAFANKYKVQINRNEETGEISIKKNKIIDKHKKELLQEAKKRLKQEKLQAKTILKPKTSTQEVDETFEFSRTQTKRAKKNVDEDEEVVKRDFVKFGETNKQPPSLAPFLTKSKKPGKRNLLLLSQIK